MHRFPFGSPLLTLKPAPLIDAKVFVLVKYTGEVHARWLNLDGSILLGWQFELLPLAHLRQAARLGAHSPELTTVHVRWVNLKTN
ncbi:MAG: hypothetical protein GX587_01285 [Bacteroidales bacterium]|nr:hypothetical protein [Bacteroidales bacterium]